MEMDLIKFHEYFSIPLKFQLEVLGSKDQAYQLPSSQMTLYKESFKAGLKLPFHPFFVTLLRFFDVLPYSFFLNSWRHSTVLPQFAFWLGLLPGFLNFILFTPLKSIPNLPDGVMHHLARGKALPCWFRVLPSLSMIRSVTSSSPRLLVRHGASSIRVSLGHWSLVSPT